MKGFAFAICLFAIFGTWSQEASQKNTSSPNIGQVLNNPNVSIRLCGDLNYARVRRDCSKLEGMDFKTCLRKEQSDPLIVEQENTEYACVNSDSSVGIEILKKFLGHKSNANSCINRKIEDLNSKILADQKVMELINKFQKDFGNTVKINYGVDTKNKVAILQIDFNQLNINGYKKDSVELNMSLYQENGPCPMWDKYSIYNVINGEYRKISSLHNSRPSTGRVPASIGN